MEAFLRFRRNRLKTAILSLRLKRLFLRKNRLKNTGFTRVFKRFFRIFLDFIDLSIKSRKIALWGGYAITPFKVPIFGKCHEMALFRKFMDFLMSSLWKTRRKNAFIDHFCEAKMVYKGIFSSSFPQRTHQKIHKIDENREAIFIDFGYIHLRWI